MANLIETNKIDGFSVYGVQMVDYTLEGVAGKDFGTAVALACFASSAAIEAEATAFADILRARQQKLKDLADAKVSVGNFIAKLPTEDPESDDTVSWWLQFTDGETMERKAWANTMRTVMPRYGLSCPIRSETVMFGDVVEYVRRDDLENARANVDYAMDMEDNDMQQDMITMQGLIGKRDNSFSAAAKIIKKVGGTADSMLRSIGQ